MRILTVRPGPNFSVADVHRGWVSALRRLGCEVADLNLDDRLTFYQASYIRTDDGEYHKALDDQDAVRLAAKGVENACYQFWPDVVLVTSGFFIPPDTYQLMRARGHTVVLLCTESPYEDESQIERAPYVDWILLNDPTNIDRFRKHNPNVVYVPHAYDPDIHHLNGRDETVDFSFVGTGYPSRVDFLEQVNWDGIDVTLGGNWQRLDDNSPLRPYVGHDLDACVDNREAADLYRRTRISANLYRKEAQNEHLADGWAVGPREIELAACGTFFLREPRGEGDQLFPTVPTFDGPQDFADKVRFYLERDDLRHKVAREARRAIADRTFDTHAAALLRLID